MINPLHQLKSFLAWGWNCARAWMELGHRFHDLEMELSRQSEERRREDARIEKILTSAIAESNESRGRLHRRIDRMESTQTKRLDSIDAAQQKRIDDWAIQLSAQINQMYVAVAGGPRSSSG